MNPRGRHSDYKVRANEVVYLKLVSEAHDLDDDSLAFHPSYTHQIFDGEIIYGYKGLRVNLYFSQPGLYCLVEVLYAERLNDPNVTDIKGRLRPLLRGGFLEDREQFLQLLARRFGLPGKRVHWYTDAQRLTSGNAPTEVDLQPPPPEKQGSEDAGPGPEDITFEIWQAGIGDRHMAQMHDRIQFFLLLYIDASSYIDASDPTWQVLCLYRRTRLIQHGRPRYQYECMGYMTLYVFFCYAKALTHESKRLRVSQVLLFPPFQRQGHGGEALQKVYNIANANSYREVNIEDPSAGMQFLRDYSDIRNCLRAGYFCADAEPDPETGKRKRAASLEKLTEGYVAKVQKDLRITKEQIIRCYECLKLETIDKTDEDEYRAYRLDVKRRLHKIIQEDLFVVNNKPLELEKRKLYLNQTYTHLEKWYARMLRKVRGAKRARRR